MTSVVTQYTTRLLTPDTWDDFAALVEANNGVWGGCWCIGFHREGISKDSTAAGNREAKLAHVNNGLLAGNEHQPATGRHHNLGVGVGDRTPRVNPSTASPAAKTSRIKLTRIQCPRGVRRRRWLVGRERPVFEVAGARCRRPPRGEDAGRSAAMAPRLVRVR